MLMAENVEYLVTTIAQLDAIYRCVCENETRYPGLIPLQVCRKFRDCSVDLTRRTAAYKAPSASKQMAAGDMGAGSARSEQLAIGCDLCPGLEPRSRKCLAGSMPEQQR